jgi:2-dehydro-3-deoxygluconokinase
MNGEAAVILGIGEPLIEMVRVPETRDGRPMFVQGFGGDTATAIIAAQRQGAKTGYLTGISDDLFGEAWRGLWAAEGVDVSHATAKPGDPTGICFIDPDPRGRRFTYARRGSAAACYGPDDLPEDAIRAAKVLHLSGITLAISGSMRAAALKAVALIRDAGGLVSLDINYRPKLWASADEAREVLSDAVAQADLLFPSDDEAEMLFGTGDPDTLADLFLGNGARVVAVKRGEKGACLATPEARWNVPPVQTTPVDSAGAGDSFAGAFLAWYLETGDARLASAKAAEVAAATVSGLGAVGPIPRRFPLQKPGRAS